MRYVAWVEVGLHCLIHFHTQFKSQKPAPSLPLHPKHIKFFLLL